MNFFSEAAPSLTPTATIAPRYDYYIDSTYGSDSNDGSKQAPFATLSALSALENDEDFTVSHAYLYPGKYPIKSFSPSYEHSWHFSRILRADHNTAEGDSNEVIIQAQNSDEEAIFSDSGSWRSSYPRQNITFRDITFEPLEQSAFRPSLFTIRWGILTMESCEISNFALAQELWRPSQIWATATYKLVATNVTVRNIENYVASSTDEQDNANRDGLIMSCNDCTFIGCRFESNVIRGRNLRSGLFQVYNEAVFNRCIFVNNSGIADNYGCGLIFSNFQSSPKTSLTIDECSFENQKFTTSLLPLYDERPPNTQINYTTGAIACFKEAENVFISITNSFFRKNFASAAGVLALLSTPPDDRGERSTIVNINNVTFDSNSAIQMGAGAIISASFYPLTSPPVAAKSSISISNVVFLSNCAELQGIVPAWPLLLANASRTVPSLIEVHGLIGSFSLINATFKESEDPFNPAKEYPMGENIDRTEYWDFIYNKHRSLVNTTRIYITNTRSIEITGAQYFSDPNTGDGGWFLVNNVPSITLSQLIGHPFEKFIELAPVLASGDRYSTSIKRSQHGGRAARTFISQKSLRNKQMDPIMDSSSKVAMEWTSPFPLSEYWSLIDVRDDIEKSYSFFSLKDVQLSSWPKNMTLQILYIFNQANITLDRLNVSHLSGFGSAPLFDFSNSHASLVRDCTFFNVSTLFKIAGSDTSVRNVTVKLYSGVSCPLTISSSSSVIVEGFTAINSTASVFSISGMMNFFKMKDSFIFGAVSDIGGGGILFSPTATMSSGRKTPQMEIWNSKFIDNVGLHGGALSCEGYCNMTVANSAFEGNEAISSSGGAIFTYGLITRIISSNFTKNHATTYGGAISAGALLTVQKSRFSENFSKRFGGAIATDPSVMGPSKAFQQPPEYLIFGSRFKKNRARIAGAGIHLCPYSDLTSPSLSPNRSSAIESAINIYNSVLEDHFADGDETHGSVGGAICTTSRIFITYSELRGNVASSGGAIALFSPASWILYADTKPEIDPVGAEEFDSGKTSVDFSKFRTNEAYFRESVSKNRDDFFASLPEDNIAKNNDQWIQKHRSAVQKSNLAYLAPELVASDVKWVENRAPYGGAIYVLQTRYSDYHLAEYASKSILESNSEGDSARNLRILLENEEKSVSSSLPSFLSPSSDTNPQWAPLIDESRFIGHSATENSQGTPLEGMGGAIYIEGTQANFSLIKSTEFSGNRALAGAVVYIDLSASPLKFNEDVKIINNSAKCCGGVLFYGYLDSPHKTPHSIANGRVDNINTKMHHSSGNQAAWGNFEGTAKIAVSAHILPGNPVSFPDYIPPVALLKDDNGGRSEAGASEPKYTTYVGAERTIAITAVDEFYQPVYALSQFYYISLLFNCKSDKQYCDSFAFKHRVVVQQDSRSSATTFATFSFEMTNPGESAYLERPLEGEIFLIATWKTGQRLMPRMNWAKISVVVRSCGAGYGQVSLTGRSQTPSLSHSSSITSALPGVRRQKFGKFENSDSDHSISSDVDHRMTTREPVESPKGGEVWYLCQVCPRYYFSLNGTCRSCADDPSIETCSADKIISRATWWVMKNETRNAFESIRCAESYCGAGNQCLSGRSGTMCGTCVNGRKESITSICLACLRANWGLIVLTFFGLWAAVLILHSLLAVSSGKATILIFFIQTAWTIRKQIPVVSSQRLLEQNESFYKFLSWALCLWPMNFLGRSLALALVPFILALQLCATFAGYHLFIFIKSKIMRQCKGSSARTASKNGNHFDEDGISLLGDGSRPNRPRKVGYGVQSDNEEDDEDGENDDDLYRDSNDTHSYGEHEDPLLDEWTSLDSDGLSDFENTRLVTINGDSTKPLRQKNDTVPFSNNDEVSESEIRRWEEQNRYFHHFRLMRTLLGLLATSFSSVLGLIMSTLGCIKLMDGSRVLAASPSISCDSSEMALFRRLNGVFVPWLILVAGFMLFKLFHAYHTNTLSRTDVRFGVWYEMYKTKLFAWKLTEFARRTLVSTIGNLLIADTSLRASLFSVLMLLSLVIQLLANPYRHRLENSLETFSLLSLSTISLLVLWHARTVPGPSLPATLSFALMIVSTVLILAAFPYRSLKERISRYLENKKRDEVPSDLLLD